MAYLIGILRTAQGMRPNRHGLEITMPNKVAALRELREMLPGWTAKTQIEVGPSQELVELLAAVRNGEPLPEAKVIELPPA